MLCGVREHRSRGYAEQQDFLVQFCGQHWSLPACLSWSRTREFIGNVFRPLWTSAEYRQHKANDVFRRWAPLLSHLSLPIHERMEAFRISVGSSVLWFVSCWTFTKTQTSKLGPWSARQLCRMVSGRRRPYELPVEHWTGSPAALLAATTSFCWSPCAVRIGIFGPQNAHDPRLGVVEIVSFRTRRTERQTEKAFTVNASMCGGGKHLWRHSTAVRVGNSTQLKKRSCIFPRLLCDCRIQHLPSFCLRPRCLQASQCTVSRRCRPRVPCLCCDIGFCLLHGLDC